jgi:hypothetical protein
MHLPLLLMARVKAWAVVLLPQLAMHHLCLQALLWE